MFGRFLRMESSKALSCQTSLSRRSFGLRVVASVAAGLVGTSGTTLVQVAGQAAPDEATTLSMETAGAVDQLAALYRRAKPTDSIGMYWDEFMVELGKFESTDAALDAYAKYINELPTGILAYWPNSSFRTVAEIDDPSGNKATVTEGKVVNEFGEFHYSWVVQMVGSHLVHANGVSSWSFATAEVAWLANITASTLHGDEQKFILALPTDDRLLNGLQFVPGNER